MEVTITYDPIEAAIEQGCCPYNPERHELLTDSDWIRSLREAVRLPELFVYRHRLTGNFILAGWVLPRRAFIELECFTGPHDRPSFDLLHRRLRPVVEQAKENIARIKERHWRTRELQRANDEGRVEFSRFLKHQGLEEESVKVLEGRSPYVSEAEGGERLRETKERIADVAAMTTRHSA